MQRSSVFVIGEPLHSSKVCERLHDMGIHMSPQYTQSYKTEKAGVARTVDRGQRATWLTADQRGRLVRRVDGAGL